MAFDGLSYGNRVGHFTYDKELATVVDAILNSTTVASHLLYNAKDFNRATLLKTVKISRRTQFQEVSGLEPLNSSAEDVTIQMQFNRALASMPTVKILSEAFARQYDSAVDYDDFEYEDVLNETLRGLNDLIFAGGTNFVGMDQISDDATNYATIGGVNRNTYTNLKGTLTNFSAAGSLSKLATMYSAISDTGPNESPTNIFTTFAVFDLIESLYTPTVRHEYKVLPVGGRYPVARAADGMGNGFTTMDWRGIPIARDKSIVAGEGYMSNLNYVNFYGDTKVPPAFSKFLRKVSLGKSSIIEGQAAMRPSDFSGFFYQEESMMPNQGGTVGRFWISGQLVSFQPRRQGKFTGFTAV
jgi:hypothetical protein